MISSKILRFLATIVLTAGFATAAHAQATRTWVSGVGDDANPCSRTAPCKTFAGAISKTASGGEINVLDPGGFGAVTITKPITISSECFEAGVLVSGTNGIIVNVPNATDVVVLRGLDFEGLSTGLSGITVITGGTVQVESPPGEGVRVTFVLPEAPAPLPARPDGGTPPDLSPAPPVPLRYQPPAPVILPARALPA